MKNQALNSIRYIIYLGGDSQINLAGGVTRCVASDFSDATEALSADHVGTP